jgi:hypothetical protein
LTADAGVGTRTQAARDGRTQLDLVVGDHLFEVVTVGVGADKLHAGDAGLGHLIHGVAPSAANANDANHGFGRFAIGQFEGFPSHGNSLNRRVCIILNKKGQKNKGTVQKMQKNFSKSSKARKKREQVAKNSHKTTIS